MRPGLETIRALLGGLDHPERAFRALHITGSKGKGSVAAMSAAVLGAAGRSVGLYTSPHLVSYRERIRVRGRPIPRGAVTRGVARIETLAAELLAAGRIDRAPTFFEVTTALAFDWFRAQEVDDGVIEVGLGGRLDATNVLDAPVGVITTIELEHTDVLGPTLEDIAREKSGILHRGMRAVVGELPPPARGVVDRTADALGVPVWHLGEELHVGPRDLSGTSQRFAVSTPIGELDRVTLPLAGAFQAGNAVLSVAATGAYAERVGLRLPPDAVRAGLKAVEWRGRLERIAARPPTYLDVAHTPESAAAVAAGLAELHPFADPEASVLLFGCLSDKRAEEILDRLAPLARTIVVAPLRSARAAAASSLRRVALGRFPRIVEATDIAGGYALASASVGADGLLLAIGSDYLAGELLESLEGRPDDEPDLSDPGLGGRPEAPAAAAAPGRAR